MTENNRIIMSIKPHFARAILNGSKRVELRRKFHKKHTGKTALVYSSSPDKKVIGEFLIGSIHCASVRDLWWGHGFDSLVGWEDFKKYFSGLDAGFAIRVVSPKMYKSPLDPWFNPPQSYMIDKGWTNEGQ